VLRVIRMGSVTVIPFGMPVPAPPKLSVPKPLMTVAADV